MSAAVLNEGKLYVVMQVMSEGFIPGEAKLAIIDTSTDTEDPASGITLNVKNPIDLDLIGNHLYVSGIGRYASSWSTPPTPAEYTGGIEKINLTNLTSEIIVDDGDATTHPYGQINGLVLVSETVGYFQGYYGWKNNALFQFNPTTGTVVSEAVLGLTGIDIPVVELSLEDQLWVAVGDDAYPEIKIINPVDNTLITTIYTDKTPRDIAFSGDLSE